MQVLEEARSIESPRAKVTGDCEPSDVGVWNQKGPLEEQYMLFTAHPSLQGPPSISTFTTVSVTFLLNASHLVCNCSLGTE